MTACRFLSRPAKAKKSALKSRAKTSTNSQTTYAGVWHLGVGDEYEGTYCTRMNPLARIDLAGVKLHYRNGGYLIVPRDGAEVSTFMPHQIARLRPMTYHHQTPEVCPDCLSMAVVTAEMNGQNTYPVKRPLNALEGTNTPTRK